MFEPQQVQNVDIKLNYRAISCLQRVKDQYWQILFIYFIKKYA